MKRVATTLAKLAVTVALLYFAVRGVDLSTARIKLAELDPLWTFAAIVACMGQLALGAARWEVILRARDQIIGFAQAFRLLLIGTFFSQTLPSTVGGDGVRLFLLRRTGVGWREAAHSVFLDRVIGLIVLALMVAASIPWSFNLIRDDSARLALAMTAALPALGGIAFLLLGRIPARYADRWLAVREVKALAETALKILLGRYVFEVVLASVASQLCAVAIAWCVGRAIDVPLTFGLAYLLILPVTLVTAVPISIAGWGVREQALQFAFLNAGLNGADGVLVSLLFGGIYLIAGLVGGLVWLGTGRRSSSGRDAIGSQGRELSGAESMPVRGPD